MFCQVLPASVPDFIEIGGGSRKFSKQLVDLTRNEPYFMFNLLMLMHIAILVYWLIINVYIDSAYTPFVNKPIELPMYFFGVSIQTMLMHLLEDTNNSLDLF